MSLQKIKNASFETLNTLVRLTDCWLNQMAELGWIANEYTVSMRFSKTLNQYQLLIDHLQFMPFIFPVKVPEFNNTGKRNTIPYRLTCEEADDTAASENGRLKWLILKDQETEQTSEQETDNQETDKRHNGKKRKRTSKPLFPVSDSYLWTQLQSTVEQFDQQARYLTLNQSTESA